MSAPWYLFAILVGFFAGWQLRGLTKYDWDRMYRLGMEHGYRRAKIGMALDHTEQEGK